MSERRLEDLFDHFRRAGDAAALAAVFDETAPELLRLARHLAADRAEAEDLVQGTFVAAIERRETFDATRRLEPWLVGILLNQASLARRARTRAIAPDRLDSRTVADPLDTVAAREFSEALTVALEKLSPTDREVLMPLLLDGKRAVQIARELDKRADTVHMRIHRALARLRRLLPASFALGALASNARALGRVRSEVLNCARIEVGATAGGAAVALVSTGVALLTNKMVIAAIALVLCIGVSGYLLTMSQSPTISNEVASTVRSSAGLVTPSSGAPDEATTAVSQWPASNTSARELAVPSSDRLLEIELVEEDGLQPAADFLAVLVDEAGAVHTARTDTRGRCAFEPTAGTGRVYIRRVNAFPHHALVDLAPGVRRIVLPRGRELSGRIELAGALAPPPINLQLSTDAVPEGLADAPKEVFAALDLVPIGRSKLLARTRTQVDGTFRFGPLLENWSGSLMLPGGHFVFVVDSIPTWTNERVFREPTSGLLLSIAYRPRIVGRLIDATSREPIPKASLQCIVTWSEGDTGVRGSHADDEGRFTIPTDENKDPIDLRFDSIRLSDGRIARSNAHRTWTQPADLYDAGEVECAVVPSRPIAFRAVDPNGRPLSEARAKIGALGPISADAQGIGQFPAVPLESVEMRVVARGYAVTTVALAGADVSPIEVRLSPTNRFTVALQSEVCGRKDLRLCLSSKEPLFGGGTQTYDWALRGDMVGRFLATKASDRQGERETIFGFGPTGELELEDLRLGVPFRLRLCGSPREPRILGPRWLGSTESDSADSTLVEVEVPPLAREEQRRLELHLQPAQVHRLKVVEGRAVDTAGRPISGASVGAQFGLGLRTEFDGRFRLELIDSDTIDVEVVKRGFVPCRVKGWDTSSARVLEARLVRGYDLRVHVVDARDGAIVDARVRADIDGFGPASRIEESGPGRYLLSDLPPGTAAITIEVGGRQYVRAHDTRAGLVRIELPVHGSLEVAWKLPEPGDEQEPRTHRRLSLSPKSGEGAQLVHFLRGLKTAGTHTFASVYPGEYTLTLESGVYDALFQDVFYLPTGAPRAVTIEAGTTKHVSIELSPLTTR